MNIAIITGLDTSQAAGPQLTQMQLNPGDKLLIVSPAAPSSQEKDRTAELIEKHLGVPKSDVVFVTGISAIGVLGKGESNGNQV